MRVSYGMSNINDNCFDIIRLFCTFTVFFGHFLTHFAVDSNLMYHIAYFIRGVPMFFFLSGLFIARSLERYSTKEYLKRRAIRIFPELWVCVLANLVIILFSMDGGYTAKDIMVYIGTQMTVFQFYTGEWLREYGVGVPNGALWTITVDIQFYILAIFLGKWMKEKKIGTWSIVILLLMILDIALERGKELYPEIVYKLLQCSIIPFLWIFLFGMCLYYNRNYLIPITMKISWISITAYLIWQYVVPDTIVRVFDGVRYNIITTSLMVTMFTGIGFLFKKRMIHDYSYSFYLYHMVVINYIINNMYKTFSSKLQFVLTLIMSVIIIGFFAYLSHYYVAGKLTKWIESRLVKKGGEVCRTR